jgi:hypothetical protein
MAPYSLEDPEKLNSADQVETLEHVEKHSPGAYKTPAGLRVVDDDEDHNKEPPVSSKTISYSLPTDVLARTDDLPSLHVICINGCTLDKFATSSLYLRRDPSHHLCRYRRREQVDLVRHCEPPLSGCRLPFCWLALRLVWASLCSLDWWRVGLHWYDRLQHSQHHEHIHL